MLLIGKITKTLKAKAAPIHPPLSNSTSFSVITCALRCKTPRSSASRSRTKKMNAAITTFRITLVARGPSERKPARGGKLFARITRLQSPSVRRGEYRAIRSGSPDVPELEA